MAADDQFNGNVEQVCFAGRLLAIIISNNFREPGVNFITPHNLSQQVAFIRHESGTLIEPHIHNPLVREVVYTQEVLLIKKGALRVDFYDTGVDIVASRVLRAGDVILLVAGGHGFEVLEEVEMIEVKQGPYQGEQDKTKFVKRG